MWGTVWVHKCTRIEYRHCLTVIAILPNSQMLRGYEGGEGGSEGGSEGGRERGREKGGEIMQSVVFMAYLTATSIAKLNKLASQLFILGTWEIYNVMSSGEWTEEVCVWVWVWVWGGRVWGCVCWK